ncbi:MAG TPA: amidohydrolase, partial [Candidatus Binatia bacterium]|nr:amidohydrolase [Candidatus Binatia bacterium]
MAAVEIAHSPNAWRLKTPGPNGWDRTLRADDPHKLFVVSADAHANEPATYLVDHIEPQYAHRLPRIERRDDGSEWFVSEGNA